MSHPLALPRRVIAKHPQHKLPVPSQFLAPCILIVCLLALIIVGSFHSFATVHAVTEALPSNGIPVLVPSALRNKFGKSTSHLPMNLRNSRSITSSLGSSVASFIDLHSGFRHKLSIGRRSLLRLERLRSTSAFPNNNNHQKPHWSHLYTGPTDTTTNLKHLINPSSSTTLGSTRLFPTNCNMSSETNHELSLTEQLATWLVEGRCATTANDTTTTTQSEPSSQKPMRTCIAVAGGGSKASSAIASVPGASSILLESIVTYDRRSFADFVTRNSLREGSEINDGSNYSIGANGSNEINELSGERLVEKTSSVSFSSDTNGSNVNNVSGNSSSVDEFHFCSVEAATLLSQSALRRSIQYSPSFTDKCLHCVGVGCTSSLVGKLSTDESGEVESEEERQRKDRRSQRKSRAFVAVSTLREGTIVWEVELAASGEGNGEGGVNEEDEMRRSRSEEESVVSNLILLSMLRYRENSLHSVFPPDQNLNSLDSLESIQRQILHKEGDSLSEKVVDENEGSNSGNSNVPTQSPVVGARRIIDGDANIVAVLPVRASSTQQQPLRMETLFSDKKIPFSNNVLIVPGSFNPPHHGHVGLANAAVSAFRRLRMSEEGANGNSGNNGRQVSSHSPSYSSFSSYSSSSSTMVENLWRAVDQHSQQNYDPTVLFEMSVTNADKPPLDPLEVERRINLFTTLDSSEMSRMPRDWGVILTNAPLFSQKANVLHGLVSGDNGNCRFAFVLGTDTMVRIINPKYYGDSQENMIDALVEMKEKGVHFIVGGRLEQGKQDGSKFLSGEEELKILPPHVREMFTLIREEDFRVDVSSTELRKKLETETSIKN